MNTLERPIFRRLEPDEIHALLARNDLGRIAYMRGTTIDVEPLHYVYANGWLYGRTSRGVKLDARSESWWPVAFEVDEIDVSKIKVGGKVVVKSNAYPGKEFEGTVAELAPSLTSPQFALRGARRPMDVEVLPVTIDLEGNPPLLPGMRADAFFK